MELPRYLDPRTTWRDTSEVDKVRLYTRQSFVSIIVLLGIVALTETATQEMWIAGAAMIATAVGGVYAVQRLPTIGGLRHGDVRWILAATAAAAVIAGAAGTAVVKMWALLILLIPVTALISLRWSTVLGLVLGIATAVSPYGVRAGVATFVVVVAMAATVKLSMWLLAVVTELDASRSAAAQLSVAEERLRFSRDLHDVVGRALSAIAVKSELAATLSRRGDERAAEQMDEVRELAQHSMTEARQLVRGYRTIDLGAELDGAASLLGAAGITTDIRGTADSIAPRYAEAAAWIVREGTTNILRHSDATRCRIDVTAHALSITNDHPHDAASPDGTGIAGLTERLTAVGGTLRTTGTSEEFTLTATFTAGTTEPAEPAEPQPQPEPLPGHSAGSAPAPPGHSAGSAPRLGR